MAKEYLRCRCPFCGMMPYVGEVLKTEEPSDLEIYRMTFGGTRPLDDKERLDRLLDGRKRRGSGKGIINYEIVSHEETDLLNQLRENLLIKAKKIIKIISNL
jgi:hypothetical protein